MWAFTRTPPSSLLFNEIQKKRKKNKKTQNEYCSEAVLKVRYIIYTENKTLRHFFFFQEKKKEINKTRNVFFVHIHSMTNHIQLVYVDPVWPE